VSCGLRDLTSIELTGLPAVLVHTSGFTDVAPLQAEQLGQPGLRRVIVPHPIQQLSTSEIVDLAGDSLDSILMALTDSEVR